MYGLEWPATEWWYWGICLLAQVAATQWRVRSHPNRRPPLWSLGLWTLAIVGTSLCVGFAPTLWTIHELTGSFDFADWPTIACWVGGPLILGAGVALLTRCWLGGRDNKLPRCTRCGYDMSGSPGLRCPECGREFRDAAEVLRSKRRMLPLAGAACVCLLGVGTIGIPKLTPTLVLRFTPTIVLIAISDPTGYGESWNELRERRNAARTPEYRAGPLTWLQRRVLVWKVQRLLADPSMTTQHSEIIGFIQQFPPDAEMIPEFIRLAADPLEADRTRWYDLLGDFQDDRASVEHVLLVGLHEQDKSAAYAAARGLLNVWSSSHDPENKQPVPPAWLTARAVVGADQSRAIALKALGSYQPAMSSVHAAMVALAEPSMEIRADAASLLLHADPHGRDSQALFLNILEHDPDIRDEAVGIVRSNEGLLEDPRIRAAYGRALLQTEPDNSRYALADMTQLGTFPEWRISVLVQALDAPALQDAALWRLGEIASRASAALPKLQLLARNSRISDPAKALRVETLVQMIQHSQQNTLISPVAPDTTTLPVPLQP